MVSSCPSRNNKTFIENIFPLSFIFYDKYFDTKVKIEHPVYHYNYISLYIIIYEQFFLIFFNLTFCKRKLILLIIFCILIIIPLFFLYQTVILQNKKVYINIYRRILYIIIYIYLYMFIYIYVYFYIKNFLSGSTENSQTI